MKKITFSLFLYLNYLTIYSQNSWSNMSPVGWFNSHSSVYIHSSLGQAFSSNTTNNNLFSQGFQFDNKALHVSTYDLDRHFEINIFPNPISDYCLIKFGNTYLGQIQLVSIEGKILHRQDVNTKMLEVNLSRFEDGVYFIHLISNKTIYKTTIIIQK